MRIKIKLESEIDFIPHTKRYANTKHFELKILFIRLIIKGIF